MRGGGATRDIATAISIAAGPDTRTMPIPPRPGGVATAAIVSDDGRMLDCSYKGRATDDESKRLHTTALPRYRRLAAASAVSRSNTRFMCHCWKICSELLTSQYSTSPAGKN